MDCIFVLCALLRELSFGELLLVCQVLRADLCRSQGNAVSKGLVDAVDFVKLEQENVFMRQRSIFNGFLPEAQQDKEVCEPLYEGYEGGLVKDKKALE